MNLQKAIKILTLIGTPEFEGHTEDILAARKLGIEAIKEVKRLRSFKTFHVLKLLPGETQE